MLNAGDLNLADGHYVAMVGRWRGQADLTERVYGPSADAVDDGPRPRVRAAALPVRHDRETLARLTAKLS